MTRRNDDEFAEFVKLRSPSLLRAAYLMVGDRGLAQDLVQEALAKTYVAWPRLRDRANSEAYARRVVTTTAITWYRRKGWHGEQPTDRLPESGEALGDHADQTADRLLVWSCLRRLPPRQRVAVVLRYYVDLTEAQTAETMGCAVGTVKSQVAAGLAKLRSQLGELSPLISPLTDQESR